MKKESYLLPLQKKLGSRENILKLIALLDVAGLLVFNYLRILIISLVRFNGHLESIRVSLKNAFSFEGISAGSFAAFLVVIAAFDVFFYLQMKNNISQEKINADLKGDQRWATFEEIKATFKEIPKMGLSETSKCRLISLLGDNFADEDTLKKLRARKKTKSVE